jgi:hypothetical protein
LTPILASTPAQAAIFTGATRGSFQCRHSHGGGTFIRQRGVVDHQHRIIAADQAIRLLSRMIEQGIA